MLGLFQMTVDVVDVVLLWLKWVKGEGAFLVSINRLP